MSSRKTAGRKAGYVRRRAGSTREKGRRALSLILAVFMVMASCLDAIPAKAADTDMWTIVFDAGEGTFSDGTHKMEMQIPSNEKVTAPTEDPVRDGYIFNYWSQDNANAAELPTSVSVGEKFYVLSDHKVEYKAMWLKDDSTTLYDGYNETERFLSTDNRYYKFTPNVTGEYTLKVGNKLQIHCLGNQRTDPYKMYHNDVSYTTHKSCTMTLEKGITYYYWINSSSSAYVDASVTFQSESGAQTTKTNISECAVTLKQTQFTYDGKAKQPEVTVTHSGTTLTQGTDYTVDYSNNVTAGTGTVTVSGQGNYTGGKSVSFTINKADISGQKPPTTISVDASVNRITKDLLTAYEGWVWRDGFVNTEIPAGDSVTAVAIYISETEKDNYNDSEIEITITRPQVPLKSITLDKTELTLTEGESEQLNAVLDPNDAGYSVTWSSENGSVASVTSEGMVKAVKEGKTTIKAEAGGQTAKCEVTVKPVPKAKLVVEQETVSFGTVEYGAACTPVDVTIANEGDKSAEKVTAKLKEGTYFSVTPSTIENIEADSSAAVTVTAKGRLDKGNYTDTLQISQNGEILFSLPVSYEVSSRKITVKAEDQTITYGDNIPQLTGTVTSGALADGDSLDSIVVYSTDATGQPEAGTYSITVKQKETAANYQVTPQEGSLTVKQKEITGIKFPTGTAIVSGNTLEQSQLKGGDETYGEFTWENPQQQPEQGTEVSVNVRLSLSDFAKKNYSFSNLPEDEYTYDSQNGTVVKAITISVIKADLPRVTFPTASSIHCGDTLEKSVLTGGSEDLGSFRWKNSDTLAEKPGTFTYDVVFTWNEANQNKYGLTDGDREIIQGVEVEVKKQQQTEKPEKAELQARTSTSIQVTRNPIYEYLLEDSNGTTVKNWQDSGVFSGLEPYTEYQVYTRYRATSTYEAGEKGEPLTVYTLVADPYVIDVSKLNEESYVEALYTGNMFSTISYSGNELRLTNSTKEYTITGNNPDVTVYAENNIVLDNVTIKKLELSGNGTVTVAINDKVEVKEGITASENIDVVIEGNGTLTAKKIAVEGGSLTMKGVTAIVGTPASGEAGITAENVDISDGCKITITGGSGAPAILSSGDVVISNSTVTAKAGAGASAVEGGTVTMKDAEVTVETDGSNVPAVKATTGNIELKGDTEVNSNTASEDNLYSKPPVDEREKPTEEKEKREYSVTYEYKDGQKTDEKKEENSIISLPQIEAERGYQMAWKEENTGITYKPGDPVTVDRDLYFTQVATPILVAQITLDSTAETIEVGDGVNLTETVLPQDALNPSVTWSSSNSQVATVNPEGNVTGIAPGTAIITVAANDGSNVSANCTVTVLAGEPEEIEVERVTISGDTKKVAPGKKVKLTATVYPDNATDKSVSWEVSNKKYASVNSQGVVTTKKAGAGKTITVTAISDSSGEEATYKISIMKNPVKKIKLSASKKVLKKGKSLKIKAKFTPSSGISKELAWTSSNTKVAVVNNQGKVTAKGKGKVKITAKAKDGSGKKATITLKVK